MRSALAPGVAPLTSLLLLAACAGQSHPTPDKPAPAPIPTPAPSTPAPDPTPQPGLVTPTARLTRPGSLQGQAGRVELFRLTRQAGFSVDALPLAPGQAVPEVTLGSDDVVAMSLYASDGTPVDSFLFHPMCPAPPPVERTHLRVVPDDLPNIQAAIEASAFGDTVLVRPGSYTESLHLRPGVRLFGAGAAFTQLTGSAPSAPVINFSDAPGAEVRGFTLSAPGGACPDPQDPSTCKAHAIIYADGHNDTGCPPTLLFTQNVVANAELGVLLYYQPIVVLRNNIFARDRWAYVADHHGDGQALLLQNDFYEDTYAVRSQASYLNLLNSILEGSEEALHTEYTQAGAVACNAFFENGLDGDRADLGELGNALLDPGFVAPKAGDFQLAPDSAALRAGCLGTAGDKVVPAGAFGGAFGRWPSAPLRPEDLPWLSRAQSLP